MEFEVRWLQPTWQLSDKRREMHQVVGPPPRYGKMSSVSLTLTKDDEISRLSYLAGSFLAIACHFKTKILFWTGKCDYSIRFIDATGLSIQSRPDNCKAECAGMRHCDDGSCVPLSASTSCKQQKKDHDHVMISSRELEKDTGFCLIFLCTELIAITTLQDQALSALKNRGSSSPR